MPGARNDVGRLQTSSTLTVHDVSNPTKTFKSFAVEKTINLDTIAFRKDDSNTVMSCAHDADGAPHHGSTQLGEDSSSVDASKLQTKVVINRFHDLHTGDLALLAMLIGMNKSDSKWCLLCKSLMSSFNTKPHEKLIPRTRKNLKKALESYLVKAANSTAKTPPANVLGVNKKPLIDIDPSQIITPTLHCPMGLVDKVSQEFKTCVNQIEFLTPDAEASRTSHVLKKELHVAAVSSLEAARKLKETEPANQDAMKLVADMKAAMDEAAATAKEARDARAEAVKVHNARKVSLWQKFETLFRASGIIREYCHGGKFNGANCMRIVERSRSLFLGDDSEKGGFLELMLLHKRDEVDASSVRSKCKDFCRMMGPLDAIWAAVGGHEAGLLPAPEQVGITEKAIDEGRQQWLKMGIGTQQPKWHLTFEGHLLAQHKKFGGLADKADDTIEAFHQTLKRLRERCRGARSHKTRENCIQRELRRQRCPKIASVVHKCERKIKQSAGTKRKQEAEARKEEAKRVKMEKRMDFVNNNN